MCPTAYCEDHLPNAARERITNKCKRFLALGQHHPKQACFLLCSKECEIYYNMTKNGTDMDAMNRDSSSDSNNTEENKADAIEVLKKQHHANTICGKNCSSGRFRLDCTDCEAILICVRCYYSLKNLHFVLKQFNNTNT